MWSVVNEYLKKLPEDPEMHSPHEVSDLMSLQRQVDEILELQAKKVGDDIRRPTIPRKELEHGAYYFGHCRNAKIARWNAEQGRFYYIRRKFDNDYVTTLPHEEDQRGFDYFQPYERLYAQQVAKIEFEEKPLRDG